MDLNELDTVAASNAGTDIELLHPVNKRPLGMFIHVVGKDSEAFVNYSRENTNNQRQRDFQARKKGKVAEPLSFDETADEEIVAIVACMTGWHTAAVPADDRNNKPAVEGGPYLLLNGEQLKFTPANATKLLKALPWIKPQLNSAVLDYENFIKT